MVESGGILFAGLGAMGTPMVRNLAKSNDGIFVHDINRERTVVIAREISATSTADPLAVAEGIGTVILMLPNSSVVSAVLGPAGDGDSPGLLETLPAGALVIDMSSSRPDVSMSLAKSAAARGVDFVDAPVSGGVARAITGELAIMVGGDDAAVERARPILDTMGSTVVRTGRVGSAHAMKALNNLLSAIGLAATSEVLAVGQKFGLDPHNMLEILNESSGRNHATENKAAKFILSREFNSGFSLNLMVKDLSIAMGLAHDVGASAPIAAAALETWTGAQAMLGDQSADHTEVARFVERNSDIELH